MIGLWYRCFWYCRRCHISCFWYEPWWKFKLGRISEIFTKMGKWCSPAKWHRHHWTFVMLVEMHKELLLHKVDFLVSSQNPVLQTLRWPFVLTSTLTTCRKETDSSLWEICCFSRFKVQWRNPSNWKSPSLSTTSSDRMDSVYNFFFLGMLVLYVLGERVWKYVTKCLKHWNAPCNFVRQIICCEWTLVF